MKSRTRWMAIPVLVLLAACASVRAATVSPAFYVAPSGNDGNSGAIDQPFATLARAKSAMESSSTHTTYLRGGTYSPSSTLTLTGSDSGFALLGYPGEVPILNAKPANLSFIIALNGATHVTLDGITFTNSISLNVDFAALYLTNSSSNTIVGNHFTNNALGILITSGSSSNVVSGNQIDSSATSAIEIKDGSNSNVLDSNLINGTGADSTHGGGFFLHGVNYNTISHNLVENTVGMGIGVSNWDGYTINIGNSVLYNVVRNANTNSVDSGSIYMLGRSQLNTQATIAFNYIDGTGGGGATHTIGIYLDDLTSGVNVHDNIIRNIGTHGVQIHGGQNNTVKNNIFDIGSGQASAILFQAAPADTNPTIQMTNDVITQNIIYSSSSAPVVYDYLDGGQPLISRNLYFNTTGASMQTNPPTQDSNPAFGNPLFVNEAAGNYALQAGSAAATVGFQAIDQSPMGLHPTTDHWYNQAPQITAGPSATPNVAAIGQNIAFSVSASDPEGDALTYSWNFGDGASASGSAVNHAYAAAGNYSATVTVSDIHGGSASATVSVTINGSSTGNGIAIDSGGPAAGSFVADTYVVGGLTASSTAPVATPGVTNPAPQAVYQSERYGNFTYTIPNLKAGAPYTVRLHFAEFYWNNTGQRVFNVAINGTQVLSNFDVLAAAGGKNIAIVRQFSATATAGGQIVLTYTTLVDNAKSSGIEIISGGTNSIVTITSPATATPASAVVGQNIAFSAAASDSGGGALTYAWNFGDGSSGSGATVTHAYTLAGNFAVSVTVSNSTGGTATSSVNVVIGNSVARLFAVNSGGQAAGSFSADGFVSGGATYTSSTSVTTAGVASPAPQAVYQSERYGNFTYTFTGLTAGASYTVRLHFAEIWWNSAGQRVFNVAINGQQVLSNFDIFAVAGGNFKAVVREFTAVAVNGQIAIAYSTLVDNAKSSGIEIIGAAPSAPRALLDDPAEPVITSIPLGSVKLNRPFRLALETPDAGKNVKLNWSSRTPANLPAGVRASGGKIGGKPRLAGTYTFDLQILGKKTSTTNTYTLVVEP